MPAKNTAWKVGLFVLVCASLLAAALMNFSKGATWFARTYTLLLRTSDMGGIRVKSSVLLAGLPIGTVAAAELSPDGRSVTLRLHILERFILQTNARFRIEQAGLLGDQYIAVIPGFQQAPPLQHGDVVEAEEPWDLQETVRSATDLIRRVNQIVDQLGQTFGRVDRELLGHETMTNLVVAVANFRILSEQTLEAVAQTGGVIQSNAPVLASALTNLDHLTGEARTMVGELNSVTLTSKPRIETTLANLEAASRSVTGLLARVENGRGLAGSLLQDEQLQQNTSELIANLTTLSSNLARYGLLHKPRRPRATPAGGPPPRGRVPVP